MRAPAGERVGGFGVICCEGHGGDKRVVLIGGGDVGELAWMRACGLGVANSKALDER